MSEPRELTKEALARTLELFKRSYPVSADLVEEHIAALNAKIERQGKALEMMYDKWENGTPCFEDPENYDGPLGNAFKLSYKEENEVLELIPSDAKRKDEMKESLLLALSELECGGAKLSGSGAALIMDYIESLKAEINQLKVKWLCHKCGFTPKRNDGGK